MHFIDYFTFSATIIYSFHLVIRRTKTLLEQDNKTQASD
jgi:hypothetical protein